VKPAASIFVAPPALGKSENGLYFQAYSAQKYDFEDEPSDTPRSVSPESKDPQTLRPLPFALTRNHLGDVLNDLAA
jgi:hypothetical protein